jgi:hypothetical protein
VTRLLLVLLAGCAPVTWQGAAGETCQVVELGSGLSDCDVVVCWTKTQPARLVATTCRMVSTMDPGGETL